MLSKCSTFSLWSGTTMDTLANFMETNGDAGKRMFYLKMDIEEHELGVLPELLDSGVLQHVEQFALEFHLNPIHAQQRSKLF